MNLSIVIPAFEEQAKIARDVQAASFFLQQHFQSGEIIVVDDGSRDQTSSRAEQAECAGELRRRVIHYDENRGKGFAVRTGILQTHGDCVLFADSGSCVPFENALRGLQLIETGACELAHGSRKLPDSEILKSQTWQRRLTARLFREVALPWMRLPAALTDTQCGFKVYRGEVARELFSACVTNGFMFDIEIIRRAQAKGYRIQEFPISWTCDRDSRLSLHRHLTHIWQELQLIRRILKE